jgi:hypothetical protein
MPKIEVFELRSFKRARKRFSKKFASLDSDLDDLVDELTQNPTSGESLGAGLYKVRLAVKSKGGGKSGGFRVITYLVRRSASTTTLYLVILYDKSEEATLEKQELLRIVSDYL